MAVDLLEAKVSMATTGIMTLTAQVFMNPTQVAAFAAVSSGHQYPTVTVDTAHSRVNIVLVITPDSLVTQAAAETQRLVADLTNEATQGVVP